MDGSPRHWRFKLGVGENMSSPGEPCSPCSGQQENGQAPVLVLPSSAGQSHICPHLAMEPG